MAENILQGLGSFAQGFADTYGGFQAFQANQARLGAFEAQRKQAEQEALMQKQMYDDLTSAHAITDPRLKIKTLTDLAIKYPTISTKLNESSKLISSEQKENVKRNLLPAYNALTVGKTDIALQKLTEQEQAFRNAGDSQQADQLKNYIESVKNAPDQALTTGTMYMMEMLGVEDFKSMYDPESTRKIIALPFEQRKTVAETLKAEEEQRRAPVETGIKQQELGIKKVEAQYAESKELADLAFKRAQKLSQDANRLQSLSARDLNNARIDELKKVQQVPDNGTVVDLGLPTPARLPWASMTDSKQKNILMGSIYKTSEKELNKKSQYVSELQQTAADVDRFIQLNKKIPTGGFVDRFGGQSLVGMTNAEYDEMRSISSRLAPRNRPEGAGATSDYDAKQYERATVGVDKSGNANLAIAKAIKARAQAASEYQDYLQNYLTQNGTLADADRNWKEYSNANPILNPKKSGTWELNPNRVPYELYFQVKSEKQRRGLK